MMFDPARGEGAAEYLSSFLRNAVGHVLIAWLRYFDSGEEGDGQVSLEEFTTSLRRLNFKGEAETMFRRIDEDDSGFLTLYEVDGKAADLWAAFRAWCAETFCSTEDMVAQLRGSLVELGPIEGEKRIFKKQKSAVPPAEFTFIREQFLENAPRHGWFGGFEDVIFTCMDRKKSGYVTQVDLPWFEKARSQHNRRMQMRPTGTRTINTTPGGAAKKNPMQALLAFMSFLRSCSMGGNLMQTWRTLLDPDASLYVQKADIQRVSSQVGWRGDVSVLWSALDAPNGRAALEEFGFKEARALAMFRAWAMAVAGGVQEAWQKILSVEKSFQRKRRNSIAGAKSAPAPSGSSDTLDREAFVFALGRIHSPGKVQIEDPSYLFSILDWEPHGKLAYKDLRFLEFWEPVKWLSEQADPQAAEAFKETVLSKYANHPVKAWRLCLDMDGNGLCRWNAFNQAAERIQWKGNCAKAWLGLDTQSLGFITLHTIDPEVAENLALFRRWCFATYGGVAIAFHALDADGSGSLSEEEFVTVIEHSSFKGDARAAWNALNLEGSDILSEREMDFLDDMELDMLAAYVSATEAAEANEAEKHKVEVDLTRRRSTVADLRRHSILSQAAQGSEESEMLLSTPQSRLELLDMIGLNHEEGSQSLSSVWTLPSLADSRSVRFETSGTKAMVGLPATPATVGSNTSGAARSTMSAKAIAKAKLEVKALMDSKTLYAGGIPYM